ncbi:unnamed protein product [Hyaloperonospora brassicae]|uniref:RxLR effector candidate protein n=1 Tax=Hyaloperonospora brassicae TaxID=162125 RepID=A0AAV0TJM2_HYABA|nr:unnamed protein product [Hyaloperonospora brassicae]
MHSTRPILIGGSGSQRSSPGTRSPNSVALASHSLPADMHHVHLSRFRTSASGARSSGLQPPRAPLVGSMPEPHFLPVETMPDLALGPRAETRDEPSLPQRAPAAVVQFASSCPGNIAFLRRNVTRSAWTPTLAPHAVDQDDFDLSKSPALAALRERGRHGNIASEEGEESARESDEQHYGMPRYDLQIPTDPRRRSERHGSCGNMSDTGDTGIFEFDDQ